ncbi:XI-2 [Symbiodinium pilosum]|uniref:XI-2 protein n=1 Tax=Symbiodinium pilosum TaxID=2952 RepID=A0A812RN46_SYMPI|nr:XI-2 [Symbiodinium pilosum]
MPVRASRHNLKLSYRLQHSLRRENIPWDALDFPDNQDSVDLLAGKGTGVFAMLDEECIVPNGSDQGYCNKLIKQHKGHRRFDEIKTKPTWFVIKHFAGPVSYCTDSFLDKNRDQLSNDLIECVGNSSNQFVANLFRKDPKFAEAFAKEEDQPKGGKKKKYTVSSEFKEQLSSLMDVVDLTEPHFIRCIKPNPQNLPDLFDRKGVTEQLRYGGVLQVVQVSRAGYPVRINHQECWDDYKVVGSQKVVSELRHLQDPKIRAQKLLEHLDAELNIPKPKHGLSWAVGKTLVFFKLPAFERVKFARLELLIKSTTLIQASWRGKVRRRMFVAIRLFTRHVQALLRSKQARADLQRRRSEDSATKLQASARAKLARTRYQNILRKVIKIQAVRRGVLGRRYAKEHKRHVSAARLQSLVRTKKDQRIYDALRLSIQFAQQRLRMRNAKGQLKKLKQEAKEVGAMMAKAQKAQEQASELRKHNEEMEAHQLQLQSENKTLSNKVKHLEETLQQMQHQFEEMKVQAAEAAKLAADQSKTVVEAEKMEPGCPKSEMTFMCPAQDLLREDPALLAASAGGTRSSLERAEHALRLLNLLKTPAAPAVLSASVLGLYAMFVGDMLSKSDAVKPEEVRLQRSADADPQLLSHLTSALDLDDWCLEVDDVITASHWDVLQQVFAQCAATQDCTAIRSWVDTAMRGGFTKVQLVVAPGSELIGKTLEDLLGLRDPPIANSNEESVVPWSVRMFRGYPLAAWRREEHVLRFCCMQTRKRQAAEAGHYVQTPTSSMLEMSSFLRGVFAIIAFIIALLLDPWTNILVGCLFIVGMLLLTSAVKADAIPEILDWNSCLTIGCGEAIFIAIRRSGLLTAMAELIAQIGAIGGNPLQLCSLSLAAQLATACLSPTPAGLLIANAATALDEKYNQLDSQHGALFNANCDSHVGCDMGGLAVSPVRNNLMVHHQFQIGGRTLKFLDCSGNDRAAHLVKEWFARTQWVFVVYSLTDTRSYEKALGLATEARQAGASVVLFANKFDLNQGKPVEVNLQEAHDKGTQLGAYVGEGVTLSEWARFAASQDETQAPAEDAAPDAAAADDAQRRSSISAAIDSVKSWFGTTPEKGGKATGVLRASLKGTKAMKQAKRDADPNADLRPVQELQDIVLAKKGFTGRAPTVCLCNLTCPERVGHLEFHSHAHPPGLEDYLLSASCLMEINAFAQRHSGKFEDVGPGSPRHDHPHDWYEIFQEREYEAMMRVRTDQFLAIEGVTAEQAVEECFRKRNEGNSKFQYFEYLAAAVDYRRFYALMLDFKEGRRNLTQWWNCLKLEDDDCKSGSHVAVKGFSLNFKIELTWSMLSFLDPKHIAQVQVGLAVYIVTVGYILFVTASKDGTVVVYRCYRTEMEIAMLAAEDFRGDNAAPPPDHSNIAVHSRLVGHSRAITSVFFNLLEDQLVTTSIDKSVRFWNVDTGEMLKVFTDSSPVPVAAFLPFNPQVFVAANSNAVLRLVNVQNGMVLQKLKVETEVRTLKFDDTGLFLLAGTKSGSIHVLEATDSSTLKFKFKVQLARGGVTCLVFVPAAHGQPPCLLVNTSDSSASIIDCTYGPPSGVLTNLAVRHRVRVAHALLPLKCCYSPSSQGYLISASEDKEVYIYSLAKGANYKMSYLKHHQVPVVAVATNHQVPLLDVARRHDGRSFAFQDTLLASADSLGYKTELRCPTGTGAVLRPPKGFGSASGRSEEPARRGHEAICDEPADLREDLRYRLARYRYTRRIEPPPPPLAMDPAFEPAPPKPIQVAAAQVMSSTSLRSFQPQRRRVQLAVQAEHRRLRLEAARTRRELTQQELEEKTLADMDRYLQRMEQFEMEKNSSRAGGRRRPLASLTLEQQLQERQKQFATIMAAAAFCAAAAKAMAGFGPISQACLSRFHRISFQEKGAAARPFACAVAINLWRSHYASSVRAQLAGCVQEASPVSACESPTPSSPSRPRKSLKESADARVMQMQLPVLDKSTALPFMWRCQLMEDRVVTKFRVRRARGHTRCLLAALRCWHPFRALRMMRDVLARIKRLQRFLRSALVRLKATRVALKAQMIHIEREIVEKEHEDEQKEMKQDSKTDFCRRMPPSHKGQDHRSQEQAKSLLPDTWRSQAVHFLLRHRRREQLQLLQEWRMDMATYHWEVQEWRRARSALSCPVMPPYPTHVPSNKELCKVITDARRVCRTGAPPPMNFLTVHKSEVEGTGLQWYPREDLTQPHGLHLQVDAMQEVIEPLVTPKGSVLEPS